MNIVKSRSLEAKNLFIDTIDSILIFSFNRNFNFHRVLYVCNYNNI